MNLSFISISNLYNSVELTEEGIALVEMALETKDLWDENDPWAR